jgi:hypothetical protein
MKTAIITAEIEQQIKTNAVDKTNKFTKLSQAMSATVQLLLLWRYRRYHSKIRQQSAVLRGLCHFLPESCRAGKQYRGISKEYLVAIIVWRGQCGV